jgi:hypothetical protein
MEKQLTLEQKDQRTRRRNRQAELNAAMSIGRLSIDQLRAISPAETSSDHHQELRMQLQRTGNKVINAL